MGSRTWVPLWRRVMAHLRGRLIAGVLLLVPVLILYWVLGFAFRLLDELLRPLLERVLGWTVPGLGILLLLLLVYLAGLVASNYLGRGFIRLGQGALLRVPFISTIYNASKQLVESFSGAGETGFKRVVAIEYPRRNIWTIGFLTGVTRDEAGKTLGIVYIPTAPTPNSGWVAILPMEEIHDTDLTVQVALRLVLSGGIVSPPQIRKLPAT